LHGPDISGTPSHSRRFLGHTGITESGLNRALAALPDTQETDFRGTKLERDLPNRVCPELRSIRLMNDRGLGNVFFAALT